MPRKKKYDVGFKKPPKDTQFQPGQSGNKKGRPKGSKNLGAAIEKELAGRVPITVNGRERRLSKGQVAVMQLVNKAAGGDMRAFQAIFKFTQDREDTEPATGALDVFDTPRHHLAMADICLRIRAMTDPPPPEPQATPTPPAKRKPKT